MPSAVEASAKGASYLILVQICSRALTFIINQALLRFLSPELLGASTQLELYAITVLYFARESFRVALQRQSSNTQAVVNISYLAVVLGFPLALLFARLYSSTLLPSVPFIAQSLNIYIIATIVELFAEPPFVVVQQLLIYKIRAISETVATFSRCIVTFLAVVWAHKQSLNLGVLPFALGQLSYASVLAIMYFGQMLTVAKQQTFSFLPRRIVNSTSSEYVFSYFSRNLLSLSLNLYFQSGIKYLLTQGDGILIASWTTLREQGAFALASNYGGLIARMVFQPIEESSRNLFAKLCAPEGAENDPRDSGIVQAQTTLVGILKFYNLLSVTFWALGPTFAPILLQMIAGNRWIDTGAAVVLAAYCYYIPLLAVNGVTEAFVAAVANNSQLRVQSIVMGGYSLGFAAAAYVFLNVLGWGALGLVYANCLNMALRILWNLWFIRHFFNAHKQPFLLQASYPNVWTIASGLGTATVLRTFSDQYSRLADIDMWGFAQAISATALFLITMILTERIFIMQWIRYLFPTRALQRTKK